MECRPYAFVVSMALAGCAASPYTLPDSAVKFRSTLTEQEAIRTVERNVYKTGDQAGLCAAHTNQQFAAAAPVAVQGSAVLFRSSVQVITGTTTRVLPAGTIDVNVHTSSRAAPFRIELKQLDKVRVQSEVNKFGCTGDLRGVIVMIDTKGVADSGKEQPNAVMVNVSKENLDRFLAALSYLSPKARLIEGMGL